MDNSVEIKQLLEKLKNVSEFRGYVRAVLDLEPRPQPSTKLFIEQERKRLDLNPVDALVVYIEFRLEDMAAEIRKGFKS